ncbi:MAG: hypothetical protein R3F40_13320 [Candidatus Competibacteraceae bacterium]
MWTAIHAGGFHGVEERAVSLSIALDQGVPTLIVGFEYGLGCLFHHLLLASSLINETDLATSPYRSLSDCCDRIRVIDSTPDNKFVK